MWGRRGTKMMASEWTCWRSFVDPLQLMLWCDRVHQVGLIQCFNRLKPKWGHFPLKASCYVWFYMETATSPEWSLFVLHLLSLACRSVFTACGVSGGVYEFIKPHDASSCFYKFRHEDSAHTPFPPAPHRRPPSSCFLTIPANSFNLVKPSKPGRSRAVTCHSNL